MKKFNEFLNESVTAPEVVVIKDYDGAFQGLVNQAIETNEKNGTSMVKKITINSGPYRPYSVSYDRKDEKDGSITCQLDFYAASRVLGYEFTINDLADMIALKMKGSDEKNIKQK
jgi:hypothetical protein